MDEGELGWLGGGGGEGKMGRIERYVDMVYGMVDWWWMVMVDGE